MKLYKLMRGKMRLHFGWCPLCNSSPPLPECEVCQGERKYGRDLSDLKKKAWWFLYKWYLEDN